MNEEKKLAQNTAIMYGAVGNPVKPCIELTHPRKGDYLLQDGSWSSQPASNKEKGIFLSPEYYLPIDWYEKKCYLTAAEIRAQNIELPSLYELLQLRNARQEVNSAYRDVKLEHLLVGFEVLLGFWSKELLAVAEDNDDGRLINIRSLQPQPPHYSQVIDGGECLLIDGREVYLYTSGRCQTADFKLFCIKDDLMLFMVDEKYVFRLLSGKMQYLGIYRGIFEDVLWLNNMVLQLNSGTFSTLYEGGVYRVYFAGENLLLHLHQEETTSLSFRRNYCGQFMRLI